MLHIDLHLEAIMKNCVFPKENHVFLQVQAQVEVQNQFMKKSILWPKDLSKLRSKSKKIDPKIDLESYLKFSSKNEAGGKFYLRGQGGRGSPHI